MRFSASHLLLVFSLAGAAFLAAPALGQDACDTGPYEQRLQTRYTDACRKTNGLDKKLTAIDTPFLALKAGEPGREEKGIAIAHRLFTERLEALPKPEAHPAALASYLASLKADVLRALGALGKPDPRDESLKIDYWNHQGDDGLGVQYLRQTGCAASSDEPCRRHYDAAAAVADNVYLARNTVSGMRLGSGKEMLDRLTRLGERWDSYLYDSQFQYFWELGFNKWLEERCPSGPNNVMSRLLDGTDCKPTERDAHGNAIRWREAPRYRAILLHPDIGFLYNGEDPKGSQVKASLVFQWFGYQWWNWKDNKVSRLKGISVVSTVADNAVGRAVGLGLQAQYDTYALAITSHGGKPVFTFSMDLLGKVSKLNDEYAQALKRADKTD